MIEVTDRNPLNTNLINSINVLKEIFYSNVLCCTQYVSLVPRRKYRTKSFLPVTLRSF